jgi:prephenate dehydrogenase
VAVTLEDPSPTALALAQQIGAGQVRRPGPPPAAGTPDQAAPRPAAPSLVLVAAPPDVTAAAVEAQLERWPEAVVTDVASVKAVVLEQLRQAGADLTRYVGSHPMAGRERSGPAAAAADLFVGRPWVIAATPVTSPDAVLLVRELATDLGAHPTYLSAAAHDQAVALISHLPQLLASLTAARLSQAEPGVLELAGQGLRDMTRIAGSDPGLWAAILAGNANQVAAVLRQVRRDLDRAIAALDLAARPETLGRALLDLADLVGAGRRGAERIPGKHGAARRVFDQVTVIVPDRPGELGRLFQQMGRLGVNLEDLALEHSAGQLVGLAEISVPPGQGAGLARDLAAQGWRILP